MTEPVCTVYVTGYRGRGHHTLAVADGSNLLHAMLEAGIAVGNDCGGNAQCATCRVAVTPGAESLPAPSDLETYALSRVKKHGTVRLACQLQVNANMEVEILDLGETGEA